MPAARRLPSGQCDVLLRADDIVHDDDAPVKAQIVRKAFRGSEFLYTLRLRTARPCWPTCPATTTTRSANGSASAPKWTTW
jgi:iron(III) transport system ATP-binding protein